MKILHLLSQMPDFTGSGKYLQALLFHAAAKGHDNYLVTGVQQQVDLPVEMIPPDHIIPLWFNTPELPFALPGMSDVMPYDSTMFSSMSPQDLRQYESRFVHAIDMAVQRFAPDLIHSHHLWIMSAAACSVAPHIPMVTTCHGTCLRQYVSCGDLNGRTGQGCRKINRIMALSQHQKQEIMALHQVPAHRIDVVGIGFDNTLFRPGVKPQGNCVEILYAGKLCRAKGVLWLLDVMAKIRDLPWRLHLAGAGAGPEKEACLKLAQEMGDQVKVHGALSHEHLSRLMGECHLFVLPSFFEGVPLVLMEALASGCRVITTTLPGTLEVLGGSDTDMVNWIHLPPLETMDRPFKKDLALLDRRLEQVMTHAITRIMADPRPDLETARQLTAPFTWQQVFARVEKVYAKALGVTGQRQ